LTSRILLAPRALAAAVNIAGFTIQAEFGVIDPAAECITSEIRVRHAAGQRVTGRITGRARLPAGRDTEFKALLLVEDLPVDIRRVAARLLSNRCLCSR
jgi:hypothetical protein